MVSNRPSTSSQVAPTFSSDRSVIAQASVHDELRDLEARRRGLQTEAASLARRIDDLKAEAARKQTELERLKLSIGQAEVAHREILERNQPEVRLPARLRPAPHDAVLAPPGRADLCSVYSCVDFARCPLASGFPVYVYPLASDEGVSASLTRTFGYNPHVTDRPDDACLFVYVVAEADAALGAQHLAQTLARLAHWRGDGRNHVLLNLGSPPPPPPPPPHHHHHHHHTAEVHQPTAFSFSFGQRRRRDDRR